MGIMDDAKVFFSQLKEDTLAAQRAALEKIVNSFKEESLKEVERGNNLEDLKELQVRLFGKKGRVTELLKFMGKVSTKDRPVLGKMFHEVKEEIEGALNTKIDGLKDEAENEKLKEEAIDISMPGRSIAMGHKHPLTLMEEEIKTIFTQIGYTVVEGYEIEEDHYNFERLNIPKDHPAREMQDTFYINDEVVLRTHTSPVQARIMDQIYPELPVKVIAPGKVFRRDDDSTHSPMFHQVEGILVDKNITFADLKGTLLHFARAMFGEDREIRLRPSYFPFTEPSAEVDVSCGICGGNGCRSCGYTGWLEILGSGMVHPRVLEMAGYDPSEVSGFAFGMGVERIAMLKYDIDDIRILYENDVRFLEQF